MALQQKPNLKIGYHLGNALQMYREQPLLYIVANLPASLALIIGNRTASALVGPTIDSWLKDTATFPSGIDRFPLAFKALIIAGLISFCFAHLGLPLVVKARATGYASIEKSIIAFPRLLPISAFILISSTLGLATFLIPGIYLFGATAAAPYFLLRDKLSTGAALKKSLAACGPYALAVGGVLGTANLIAVLGVYVFNIGLFVTYPIYMLTIASVGNEFARHEPSFDLLATSPLPKRTQ